MGGPDPCCISGRRGAKERQEARPESFLHRSTAVPHGDLYLSQDPNLPVFLEELEENLSENRDSWKNNGRFPARKAGAEAVTILREYRVQRGGTLSPSWRPGEERQSCGNQRLQSLYWLLFCHCNKPPSPRELTKGRAYLSSWFQRVTGHSGTEGTAAKLVARANTREITYSTRPRRQKETLQVCPCFLQQGHTS